MKEFIKEITKTLPDTVKIVIATLIIAIVSIGYIRAFQVEEISAFITPIQETNNARFEMIQKNNDYQFKLLRDDLREVKKQNREVIELLLRK